MDDIVCPVISTESWEYYGVKERYSICQNESEAENKLKKVYDCMRWKVAFAYFGIGILGFDESTGCFLISLLLTVLISLLVGKLIWNNGSGDSWNEWISYLVGVTTYTSPHYRDHL